MLKVYLNNKILAIPAGVKQQLVMLLKIRKLNQNLVREQMMAVGFLIQLEPIVMKSIN